MIFWTMACVNICMHTIAVCSEMVFMGFANNRFIFLPSFVTERYIQQPDCVL